MTKIPHKTSKITKNPWNPKITKILLETYKMIKITPKMTKIHKPKKMTKITLKMTQILLIIQNDQNIPRNL